MVNELNNKKTKHDRLNNMKQWTAEDYAFYRDFFRDIFGEDSKEPVSEEEEKFIEGSYKRFMKKIKPPKGGKP